MATFQLQNGVVGQTDIEVHAIRPLLLGDQAVVPVGKVRDVPEPD